MLGRIYQHALSSHLHNSRCFSCGLACDSLVVLRSDTGRVATYAAHELEFWEYTVSILLPTLERVFPSAHAHIRYLLLFSKGLPTDARLDTAVKSCCLRQTHR